MRRHVLPTFVFIVSLYGASTYSIPFEGYRNYDNFDDDYPHDDRKNEVTSDDVPEEISSKEKDDAMIDLPPNGDPFEGDIIMDDRLRRAVLGEKSKKSIIGKQSLKWPSDAKTHFTYLYYQIDPSLARCARKLLRKGMEEFHRRTCIRFKRRTTEPDYVIYTSEKNMCSSHIGRIGGPQKIFIGHSCCVLGTVEHETMHSLGFIHEHSRPDRDEHVKILWDNIKKSEWSNFNKYTMDETSNLGMTYNLASVMQYRNDAFTKNGEDTISAVGEPKLHFGQRIKFSVGDVKGINRDYNQCHVKADYLGLFKDYEGKPAKRKRDRQERLRQFISTSF